MLRKDEKKAITRLLLLVVGWGLGLDRFYDGQNRAAIFSIVGWSVIFSSLMLLIPCHGYDYAEGGMQIAETTINPLILLPLVLGGYGGFLVIRKAFRLLRQFEVAED